MITVNGMLGLSLFVACRHDALTRFNAEGTGGALATVATLATVCLVLPVATIGAPGPVFTARELASPPLRRWSCIPCSSSPRPCGTVTSSSRSPPTEGSPRGPRRAAHDARGPDLPRAPRALPRRGGRARQGRVPGDRVRSAVGGPAPVVRGRGDRAARAASREHRRRQRGPARAGADESQPGARLGRGEHRDTIPALAVASIWITTPLELGLGSTQIVLLVLSVVVGVLTVVGLRHAGEGEPAPHHLRGLPVPRDLPLSGGLSRPWTGRGARHPRG